MALKRTRPYGSWPSPITIAMAVGASRGLSEPRPDGDDLYFLESRPEEAGRVVLMRRSSDGATHDVVPEDLNVRTRVHEYGGGAYDVRDGLVAFSEFAGNRLMLQRQPGDQPAALTSDPALRFADLGIDPLRERVLAILEDHRVAGQEPRNLVCAVPWEGGEPVELVIGHDFFSDPRLRPDGSRLAWLSWDHPNMPWDGSDLWVAEVGPDGFPGAPVHVAGGREESIVRPVWAPDGSLVYVSDRTGWWNPYRWREGASGPTELAPMDAEFGGPQWVFGASHLDVDGDGTVVAASQGADGAVLHAFGGSAGHRRYDVGATSIDDVRVQRGTVTFVSGAPTRPSGIHRLDLATGEVTLVRASSTLEIDPAFLSVPRKVTFPTSGGRTSHAWYYPPTNPDAKAPESERPPLVVMSHGGPTSAARTSLSLARQAFTSRGIAVVDVDYGGSSGYGRAYRDRLLGGWGVVDVEDCVNAALWLADEDLVDRERMAIRGGSAGGFTTLAALAFTDVFRAGVSSYGIGDLEAMLRTTHKFESRYLEGLIAAYPERADLYRERSPIHHVERMSCPILVLQGADDLVVPRDQADDIVDALARKGIPRAYLLFEGEGHGFRRAENQRRALESELSFYAQVFGFELADDLEPIEVVGLRGTP